MEAGRQILYKLAEINPAVRREEKDDFIRVKGIFNPDKLHIKLVRGYPLLAYFKSLGFLFFAFCKLFKVTVGSEP